MGEYFLGKKENLKRTGGGKKNGLSGLKFR